MGNPRGFLTYNRELPPKRQPNERIKDYKEFYLDWPIQKSQEQAARCMDCGVPFCHTGCPLGNNIPEFNDAAYKGNWKLAAEVLWSTNNFPEFTGRICPAPCESACVLAINKPAVSIEHIEKQIAEQAFKLGYVKPYIPDVRTGKKVAVVGSGPAGLGAAAQLNKAGHWVTVYERADRIGGLLRYGIPDFKLEKNVIDRRLEVMEQEGIIFETNVNVGEDITAQELHEEFDAVVLTTGATTPRDLPIPGRELNGVHYAMDYLTQQNKRVAGDNLSGEEEILATNKHVVVLGGGDTGSDCVGNSNRNGAKSVTQIELLTKPPLERPEDNPWPEWPMTLKTSDSHKEGVERSWSILTKEFIDDGQGNVKAIKIVDIEWKKDENNKDVFEEVEGSEREIPCDLALLSIGFVHPDHNRLIRELGVELDDRGNIKGENNYQTNIENVFSAGDCRRGQSLVVWAISEGRETAKTVDEYLMGISTLEGKNDSYYDVNYAI